MHRILIYIIFRILTIITIFHVETFADQATKRARITPPSNDNQSASPYRHPRISAVNTTSIPVISDTIKYDIINTIIIKYNN